LFVILESNSRYWKANRFRTHAAAVEKKKKFTGNAALNIAAIEYFVEEIYRLVLNSPHIKFCISDLIIKFV